MLSVKRDPFLFYEISEEQLSTAFIHVLAAATTTGRRVSGLHSQNPWAAAEVASPRPSPGGGELASRNLCPHSESHPPTRPSPGQRPQSLPLRTRSSSGHSVSGPGPPPNPPHPFSVTKPRTGPGGDSAGPKILLPNPANSWESPRAGWTASTFTRQLGETLGWQRWRRGWGEWNTALTGFMRDTGPRGHQRYHSWHDWLLSRALRTCGWLLEKSFWAHSSAVNHHDGVKAFSVWFTTCSNNDQDSLRTHHSTSYPTASPWRKMSQNLNWEQ